LSFDSLLGAGGPAQQLLIYGVGYEIARALLGPLFTQIEYDINNNSPIIELTPPELADLVVRGVIANEPDAAARAQVFGLSAGKFQEMVQLAGEPPGLIQVLEWWRRGYLPLDGPVGAPSVHEAIRTSRIYDYWTPVIESAQFQPPGPADAVNAVQRNQITLAEGIAMAYYAGLGVASFNLPPGTDTTDTTNAFTVLLNTRGNPPSPGELATLANRRSIRWGDLDPASKAPDPTATTFSQGIYEGDSKDKWLPFYADLAQYYPPPRTITTLLRAGAITVAQATTYFEAAGMSPELADAYIASAASAKTATTKALNEATVEQLLLDNLITADQAAGYLEALGYTPTETGLLVQSVGLRQTLANLNKNISRVGTYYIAHKIDRANAAALLANLGLDAASADAKLAAWDVDRSANVRVLTAAQIASAWEYQILSEAEALAELGILGYTPLDAWTVLSIKAKTPLPGKPAGLSGLVA
jgi:hypothetical protein